MKKIVIWILVAILAIGALVGIGFGIKAAVDSKEDKASGPAFETLYLQEKYSKDEPLMYRFVVQEDKAITSFKYTIDNGAEISVDGKSGEVGEDDEYDADKGAYYFDTGVEIVSLADLNEGTHVLTFYAYQDTTRIEVYVHIFKVVA